MKKEIVNHGELPTQEQRRTIAFWRKSIEGLKEERDELKARYESIRPEIMQFAKRLEEKIAEHDEERGDGWKEESLGYLSERLDQERIELQNVLDVLYLRFVNHKSETSYRLNTMEISSLKTAQKECLDVTAFAMFLYTKLKGME